MRNKGAWWMLLWLWPASATAQDVTQEIATLRQEVAALRAELAQLRAEVTGGRPAVPAPQVTTATGAVPQPVQASADAALAVVRAQLEEHAQTKVESGTRLPLKLSGSIVSTTFQNSGNPNWLDLPNLVRTSPGEDGTFSSTLRQSRVGIETTGLTIGGWRASGALIFDFFGGIPAFQTGQVMGLPRLLYAFARIEGQRAGFQAGQDDAIVAPRNPTSVSALSFPALFRSGNLYLRVPQVRAEVRVPTSDRSALRLIGGIAAPIAGDLTGDLYVFVPPDLAGERSERPAFQGRAVWELVQDDRHAVAFGISGHQSRPQFQPPLDSWIGAVDFDAQWGPFGVAGEAFAADRAAAYGAALGQQARTAGGWGEVRLMPVDRWRVVVGGGTDRLRNASATTLTLGRNASGFAGVRYNLSPELSLGMEYSVLRTTPVRGASRRNHHVDWVLRYDF